MTTDRLGTMRRLLFAAWPVLLAITVFLLIAASLQTRDIDLDVYWKAAQRCFNDGQNPYPRQAGDRLPFTYPPTALLPLFPLSLVKREVAGQWLWWLNLALVPLLAWVLLMDLSRRSADVAGCNIAVRSVAGKRLLRWGPLYLALFGGLYLNLVFYQVNSLILLGLWLYWRQIRLGRPSAGAGAGLALGSIAKPHYALLLFPPLLAAVRTGRLHSAIPLLVGALGAGAAIIVLSGWLAPCGNWASWWQLVPRATSYTELPSGHSTIAAPWNRSLPGLVARFLVPNKFSETLIDSPLLAAWLSTLAVVGVALVTGWLLIRCRRIGAASRPDPVRVDLQLAIVSVAIFLAAPASWTHHLVLLLPAALILLRDGVLDPQAAPFSRLTAALVLSTLALTFDDLIPRELRTSSLAVMSLMTVAVIALWLLLAQRLCKLDCAPLESRKGAPPPMRIQQPTH